MKSSAVTLRSVLTVTELTLICRPGRMYASTSSLMYASFSVLANEAAVGVVGVVGLAGALTARPRPIAGRVMTAISTMRGRPRGFLVIAVLLSLHSLVRGACYGMCHPCGPNVTAVTGAQKSRAQLSGVPPGDGFWRRCYTPDRRGGDRRSRSQLSDLQHE